MKGKQRRQTKWLENPQIKGKLPRDFRKIISYLLK